MFSHFKR